MKIKIQKIQSTDALFFLAYGLFMFFSILSASFYYKYFIGTPYKLIILICMVLLILREVVISKYTIKNIVGVFLCILLVLITWRTSAGVIQNTVGCMFVFVYCARNVEFQNIVSFTVVLTVLVVAFVILSGYIGIIDNYVFVKSANRIRYYLGFRYALYAPAFVFNITSLEVYAKKQEITWRMLFILLLVNLWVYMQTNSRLSFYLAVALITVAAIMKLKPDILEKRKITSLLMIPSFILCFLGSIYLTAGYNKSVEWKRELNTLFESRLSLGKSSLLEHGISLFGKKINWVGWGLDAYGNKTQNTYSYVDSLYIQVLQRYGIIFTILFLALLTATLIQCYRRKDYYLMIALVFIAGHGIVDDLTLYLYYNTFWFAIGIVLLGMIQGNGFSTINPLNSKMPKNYEDKIN